MGITLRKPIQSELILLHDSYFHSSEPDAPKKLFVNLNDEDKQQALNTFSSESHLAACSHDEIIGFVGHYPDDHHMNVNIFAVIIPSYRGQGYFSLILNSIILYCKNHYPNYQHIRSLSRKDNIPAIKGLKSLLFKYKGTYIEEYDKNSKNDVEYEEYILEINS